MVAENESFSDRLYVTLVPPLRAHACFEPLQALSPQTAPTAALTRTNYCTHVISATESPIPMPLPRASVRKRQWMADFSFAQTQARIQLT